MSHSGVPGIEQIGQAGADIGDAVGNMLHPGGDLSPAPPAPAAPPPTPTPSDPATSAAMSKAENEEDQATRRGQASNMLFGDSGGATSQPSIARSVLLGS